MEMTNAWTAGVGEARGAYRDEDGVPLTYAELAELYRRSEREAEWLLAILCCVVGSLVIVAMFLLYSTGALEEVADVLADNIIGVVEFLDR